MNNVKLSVAYKIGLLVGFILISFLLLTVYILRQLGVVGHEIRQLHDRDLPLLVQVDELRATELERHIFLERAHAAMWEGETFDGSQGADFVAEYDARSRMINEALSGESSLAGAEVPLVQLFAEVAFAVEILDASALNEVRQLDDALAVEVRKLFDGSTGKAEHEDALLAVEGLSDQIESALRRISDAVYRQSEMDAEQLLATESKLIWITLIASSVLFILSALASWIVITRIIGPLQALTYTAGRISQGDLSGEPPQIKSEDELKVLGLAFIDMQSAMRRQITELKKSIETLGASIQQTSASIQEQASSTKEEAATVQEITTTMQEIQQSGSEIAQRAGEVSKAAEDNYKASENGLQAVEATSRSMESIREQIEEVAEKIVNLSDKTQAIGDIVTTVNDIAEQSNILAINASIEAVSAGERGGRFGIVAQEMKHLADQAKDCTGQVRSILGDIQRGINTSVMLTEEAVKRSESGKEHSKVADQTIRQLLESTGESLEAFRQIIAGTNQQQIGVDQVAQGMRDIRQAVQQTVAGISELEQATASLNEMSVQLRGIISEYKL